MRGFWKFLAADAAWAAAIMLLVVPITILSGDDVRIVHHVRWLAHSLALAALPAGIHCARERLVAVALGALTVAVTVFVVLGFVAPGMNEFSLFDALFNPDPDWRRRNPELFLAGMTIAESVSAILFAGVGVQLGYWRMPRAVNWAVALLILMVSYAIPEIMWEQVLVRVQGPLPPLSLLQLLMPFGLFAGMTLATLASRKQ